MKILIHNLDIQTHFRAGKYTLPPTYRITGEIELIL